MSRARIQEWADAPPAKLRYKRALLLRAGTELPEGLAQHGAQYLDSHDAVLMLSDLDTSAARVRDVCDRQATEALLPSLLVPVYDDAVVWLRRCDETAELLQLWREEWQKASGPLALLRAVYQVPMRIWYLPPA